VSENFIEASRYELKQLMERPQGHRLSANSAAALIHGECSFREARRERGRSGVTYITPAAKCGVALTLTNKYSQC
jgi:hypothetical protein